MSERFTFYYITKLTHFKSMHLPHPSKIQSNLSVHVTPGGPFRSCLQVRFTQFRLLLSQ